MILNVLAEKLSRVERRLQASEFRDLAHRAGRQLASALSAELPRSRSNFVERGFESKNRVAFQSAQAHFDAICSQAGRAFKRGTRLITAGGRRYDRLPVRSYSYGRCGAFQAR